ncbi:MAG: FKBP-type peptidyl-prolyl cis-trans isomerase [Oscillospiraceae bacterium]|nr:FKBP-type peptidyl-prolyl cis-trans isomerase [Oscillospiraceae bacterium]
MKKRTLLASLLMGVILFSFAACTRIDSDRNDDNIENTSNNNNNNNNFDAEIFLANFPEYVLEEFEDISQREINFSSNGIDENGHWANVVATDYVDFRDFDFNSVEIPHFIHIAEESLIDNWIFNILSVYELDEIEITNRAIRNGDLVNLDYIGTIDGEEFEGGNSFEMPGQGLTYVTAGSTEFIDDFLDQIIGHSPGDVIDVEVTFPEEYDEEDLAGRDAVFVVTINYIVEFMEIDLINDSFVEEHFYDDYGWLNIEQMRESVREMIIKSQEERFIAETFSEHVDVIIPEHLLETAAWTAIKFHQQIAEQNQIKTFSEYLQQWGVEDGIRGMVRILLPEFRTVIHNLLVLQAMAEVLEIEVDQSDVEVYLESIEVDSLESAVEERGMPFLKQETLGWMMRNHILENATLLERPQIAD